MKVDEPRIPAHPAEGAPVTEAIILAGGLGTRLRSAVPDLPKCMAPVAGRPFISYVIDHLRMQGIQHIVFSLGYMAGVIEAFLSVAYPQMKYSIVIEEEPLGTGGAIQLALTKTATRRILIVNGDTLFKIDLRGASAVHNASGAECTLTLKPMRHFTRYGVVEIDTAGKVLSFKEKRAYEYGLINGGVYLLERDNFLARMLPQKFSFETDYLEKVSKEGNFYGVSQDHYFIDIGIPEDFEKARKDLEKAPLLLQNIMPDWTLFLDRDGVINEELPRTYVLNRSQFRFNAGALAAMPILAKRFKTIVIVSNQKGIGKGLMSESDIADIHAHMIREVEQAEGRIDGVFYCTHTNDDSPFRKPNPGMALQAVAQFPSIDFSRSIMVGNKPGDMQFGRAAGVYTLFITSTDPAPELPHPDVDLVFPSLSAFAAALQS